MKRFLYLIFTAHIFFVNNLHVVDIKKAHLSNEWYPSNPEKLKKVLTEFDKIADEKYGADAVTGVRVLIVPHGSFDYSGVLATACFRLLDKKVHRIIVLAPCHKVPYRGVLLPSYSAYKLCSGTIPIDTKVIRALQKIGRPFSVATQLREDPHYKEHTLEIELPLIQRYAPHAKLIPLFVGALETNEISVVARHIKKHIDRKTVIIISADFTHYGPAFDNVPFKNDEIVLFKMRALDNQLLQPVFHRSLKDFLKTTAASNANLCGKSPLSLLLALFEEGAFSQEIPYLIGYETCPYKKNDIENKVGFVGIAFAKAPSNGIPSLTNYEKRSLNEFAYNIAHNEVTHKCAEELLYPIISPTLEKPAHLFTINTKKSKKFLAQSSESSTSLYKQVLKQVYINGFSTKIII